MLSIYFTNSPPHQSTMLTASPQGEARATIKVAPTNVLNIFSSYVHYNSKPIER